MIKSPLVTSLIAIVFSGAWLGGAACHDIWVTVTGPASARRAVVNYGHPHDRPPTVADKIIDVFAFGKTG
jgi:nickel transport protein